MATTSRRSFLGAAVPGSLIGLGACRTSSMTNPNDIAIESLQLSYEDFHYRTPIKFGGVALDRATILNVNSVVRGRNGKQAKGFGSMPMGNVWAFPSHVMSYDDTLAAMKALAGRILKLTGAYKEYGHPVDINVALEPGYLQAAAEVSRELKLADPIPKLCTLVVASAFDAALHDAYGKLHNRNCYHTYGPEFMSRDLSVYLGAEFKGEYLEKYVMAEPKPRMPLYHLIGALDPIEKKDVAKPVGDGLPETLPEWIVFNGLTHLKIKLNGSDLKWDVERVVRVERTCVATQAKRGVKEWVYSCDFNEKCPNVEYLLQFLHQVKEKAPAAFERLQYIEQPTKRDLKADRANVMHEASKLRPVVIDESLVDQEALMLAREMGYTGVALKACKGQSQALLMASVAQKYKMFLCVQDLTCPGASLIHSAGIAAHVPGVAAIESNARQYMPAANEPWVKRFPEMFIIKDGTMGTAGLNKVGLSAVEA
jgi:L-alanine-DL-glutamate epimerase-like enolase superfamily enzyme